MSSRPISKQPIFGRRTLLDAIRTPDISLLKPAFQFLALLITIFVMGVGVRTAYAAGETLPGDTLYPLKTGIEEIRLLLSFDAADDALLKLEFAQRRVGEMKSLSELGRYEDIPLATEIYQTHILDLNQTMRKMALEGDPKITKIGELLEETLFYDTIVLTGLAEAIPPETLAYIEVAIGASKSGNAIARQWVELATAAPSSLPSALPPSEEEKDLGIPLPTAMACWPADLGSNPPAGIPLCEGDQTPVPLPEDLVLFCWPSQIPFDPPQDIPICGEGEAPIPLPADMGLICWPREVSNTPPPGLNLCQDGQLPVPLPPGYSVLCWPNNIPFNPPPGIPSCSDTSQPTPAPEELPCWPPELSPIPPPGMILCEPGEFTFPDFYLPGLNGTQGGGVRDLVQDILSQLPLYYCWPNHLEQDSPPGMPLCQPE
jgi:hypothetical protein